MCDLKETACVLNAEYVPVISTKLYIPEERVLDRIRSQGKRVLTMLRPASEDQVV